MTAVAHPVSDFNAARRRQLEQCAARARRVQALAIWAQIDHAELLRELATQVDAGVPQASEALAMVEAASASIAANMDRSRATLHVLRVELDPT